jgi:hypothetical protein
LPGCILSALVRASIVLQDVSGCGDNARVSAWDCARCRRSLVKGIQLVHSRRAFAAVTAIQEERDSRTKPQRRKDGARAGGRLRNSRPGSSRAVRIHGEAWLQIATLFVPLWLCASKTFFFSAALRSLRESNWPGRLAALPLRPALRAPIDAEKFRGRPNLTPPLCQQARAGEQLVAKPNDLNRSQPSCKGWALAFGFTQRRRETSRGAEMSS